jgi:hypothetical protein
MTYLPLSNTKAIALRGLIGIFDLDTVTVSRHSRDFLSKAQQRGQVHDAGGDLPKSFALTDGGVWLSPLNSATLHKRLTSLR